MAGDDTTYGEGDMQQALDALRLADKAIELVSRIGATNQTVVTYCERGDVKARTFASNRKADKFAKSHMGSWVWPPNEAQILVV